MKKRIFYISGIITLVTVSSGLSGLLAYKYAKKEAEFEKNAAVKGVEYDLRERLSQEAIDKAESMVEKDTSSTRTDAQRAVTDFYNSIVGKDYGKAWELLSIDGQKKFKNINTFSSEYKNIESVKIDKVEYRTSTPLSEMDLVTLDIRYKNETSSMKNGKTTIYINTINSDGKWLIDSIEKTDSASN